MGYSEGQLNGAADYRGFINVYRVSSNNGGNFSTFYWEIGLQNPAGQGAWTASTSYWSASIGGNYREGSFGLPQSDAGKVTRVVANGYVDIGHDSEGWRTGFASSAYFDTPHSNIGDGGSGDAWTDAPRIAKKPTPPQSPSMVAVDSDTVRVSFTQPADARGDAIDFFLVRIGTTNPPQNGTYTDKQSTSSPVDMDVTPGETYYAVVYANNGATWDNGGYSNPSAVASATTPAGIFVSDGTNWVEYGGRVSDETNWLSFVPSISTGSAWVAPA